MRAAGTAGSIVTLLCDSGDRYARTYYDDDWVAEQGWDLAPYRAAVRAVPGRTGRWSEPAVAPSSAAGGNR